MVAACHIIKLGNRWRRHQAHSDYDLKLDSDKQPKTAETVEDCRLQTVDCRVQTVECRDRKRTSNNNNKQQSEDSATTATATTNDMQMPACV